MDADGKSPWVVREDCSMPVLIALALRQLLGIRYPEELPHLRNLPPRHADAGETADAEVLERAWRGYWEMTVEPLVHPSAVPLELVDGYGTLVALPVEGFEPLSERMVPLAPSVLAFCTSEHERYRATHGAENGAASRPYASAITQFERTRARRAHPFDLNVQILPLSQRGIWWIGAMTIAVSESLRGDVAAFDAALAPIIAEIA